MAPDPLRTQEQSIKARKNQLFEADAPVNGDASGPRRSFQECLRTTPATPLSTPVKALLWGLGAVVTLLLIVALATGGPKKPKAKKVVGFVPSIERIGHRSTGAITTSAPELRPGKNEANLAHLVRLVHWSHFPPTSDVRDEANRPG